MDKFKTVTGILEAIYEKSTKWGESLSPWFRGQPYDYHLIPKVLRKDVTYDETSMLHDFRNKAQALYETPENERLDKWLFLAQHFGLPTRLLDWTESPLIALFFALNNPVPKINKKDNTIVPESPTIWMLNPIALNSYSKIDSVPLSWVDPGIQNFHLAFNAANGMDFPLAIRTVNIDKRMSAQKSCFTIHGKKRDGINEIFSEDLSYETLLVKFEIDSEAIDLMKCELCRLGVTHSMVFPDIEGLSKELEEQYRNTEYIKYYFKTVIEDFQILEADTEEELDFKIESLKSKLEALGMIFLITNDKKSRNSKKWFCWFQYKIYQ